MWTKCVLWKIFINIVLPHSHHYYYIYCYNYVTTIIDIINGNISTATVNTTTITTYISIISIIHRYLIIPLILSHYMGRECKLVFWWLTHHMLWKLWEINSNMRVLGKNISGTSDFEGTCSGHIYGMFWNTKILSKL